MPVIEKKTKNVISVVGCMAAYNVDLVPKQAMDLSDLASSEQ